MTAPEGPRPTIRFGQTTIDPSAPRPFGRAGLLAGILALVVVLGGLVWSAASGRPPAAQKPSLFGGSLVLEDTRPLTVIDVATAQITVRLEGVDSQVGAANYSDVQPVPVSGGTMLVNQVTGGFNYLEDDDYVADTNGPGVGLGPLAGSTGAIGFASGSDAYILRTGSGATVSLVGPETVAEAARAQASPAGGPATGKGVTAAPAAAISPLGYANLAGSVVQGPGRAAVSGGNLWVLVDGPSGCTMVELAPAPSSRLGLQSTNRAHSSASCTNGAIEADRSAIGMAVPGQVQVVPAAGATAGSSSPTTVSTPFTSGAVFMLPIAGAEGQFWFLAENAKGWLLFGVTAAGRTVGPYPLTGFAAGASPVVPALSDGMLYTLDQSQSTAPTLWTIDPSDGDMAPLAGVPRYPVLSSTEKDDYHNSQVLVDGPRVVFNNPQGLEAVVVFTDGSHAPVVVDKSQAVEVSTTGPADLNAQAANGNGGAGKKSGDSSGTAPAKQAVPVVAPVSQQVTCANTTQKPYAPQITTLTPASGAVLVDWSYQLLDQTDCEPDSWSVQVTALAGGHQPGNPVQLVSGQDQYLFTGLRPTTEYQVVVTAYINQQSTSSAPATFTTTARGPDAPLSVHTTADDSGDWIVSWTPCTTAANANCVVPADQWTVIGTACDGSVVGTPPTVQVAGSQDSVTINSDTLDLLGDSLSFSVQGSLASGLTGNETSDGSCTQSWQDPIASDITLSGQGAPAGTAIDATLTVGTTGGDADPFGLPTGQVDFVYSLATPGGVVTHGPTTATSNVFYGLPPGEQYSPSVVVYPVGHPGAAVTVTGSAFSQTLSWPADLEGGTVATGNVDPTDPNQGSVTVTLPADLPNGPISAIGTSAGAVPSMQCGGSGGAVVPFADQAVDADRQLTFQLPDPDLVNYGGSCTVSFSLTDGAEPDPYGGPSPAITVDFTLGTQPTYSYTVTFTGCQDYQCGPLGSPYSLTVAADDPYAGGGNFSITVQNPDTPSAADTCSYTSPQLSTPPAFPYTFSLPQGCLTPDQLSVTVSWMYLSQTGTWTGNPQNSPGSPATTLPPASTVPPSSTTTTTVASTTTTAASTTSTTTSSCDTSADSSTTDCSAGTGQGRRSARTDLASAGASRATSGLVGVLGWTLAGLAVPGLLGTGGRVRRHRRHGREPNEQQP